MRPGHYSSDQCSAMKKLGQPRKIALKKFRCGRVLMQGRDRMDADGATAERIIAAGAAANRDDPYRAATQGDTTDGSSPDCKDNPDGAAADRNQANGETAKRDDATGQATTRKPAGRQITKGENAASVTAHLAALPIRTERDSPQRQAEQLA